MKEANETGPTFTAASTDTREDDRRGFTPLSPADGETAKAAENDQACARLFDFGSLNGRDKAKAGQRKRRKDETGEA